MNRHTHSGDNRHPHGGHGHDRPRHDRHARVTIDLDEDDFEEEDDTPPPKPKQQQHQQGGSKGPSNGKPMAGPNKLFSKQNMMIAGVLVAGMVGGAWLSSNWREYVPRQLSGFLPGPAGIPRGMMPRPPLPWDAGDYSAPMPRYGGREDRGGGFGGFGGFGGGGDRGGLRSGFGPPPEERDGGGERYRYRVRYPNGRMREISEAEYNRMCADTRNWDCPR